MPSGAARRPDTDTSSGKPKNPTDPKNTPVKKLETPTKEAVAKARAEIEKLGGTFPDDEKDPQKPVLHITFNNVPIKDADLVHLKAFIHLEKLDLYQTQVTGKGLENLEGFPDLQVLHDAAFSHRRCRPDRPEDAPKTPRSRPG